MGYPATPIEKRFEAKVERCPMSGCWLWSDAPDRYGYGCLRVGRRAVKAHRLSYELHKGPIPASKLICHRCDTRACVNPDHLFVGDWGDNVQDMMTKGRFRPGGKAHPGRANGRAVLTEEQAIGLLLRRARGEFISPTGEARRRQMNRTAIQRLLSGHSWRHLPRAEAALIALYGARQAVTP